MFATLMSTLQIDRESFMFLLKKRIKKEIELDIEKLPTHIAIIPDGNRRWAKQRGLGPIFGHREGAKRIKEITNYANKIGIKFLSFYIFSTENWLRTKREVNELMNLILEFLKKAGKELEGGSVKVKIIGDIETLPYEIREEIIRIESKTEGNTGINLNLYLNYGSRKEILDAIKKICNDVSTKKIDVDEIESDLFSSYLYCVDTPDPDLVIRTSGELRLSNFLLWQNAYAEFYFTKKMWPSFNVREFTKSMIDYQKRIRRFGGL